jgi:hypothetical protein
MKAFTQCERGTGVRAPHLLIKLRSNRPRAKNGVRGGPHGMAPRLLRTCVEIWVGPGRIGNMIEKFAPLERSMRALSFLLLPICCSTALMAQNQGGAGLASGSTMRVTHVLGFESVSNNANGELSIKEHTLRFQKSDGSIAQVSVESIQDLTLGVQDRQMGGTAMAVGRAATPYGGGRLISLFSHKKYDTLTVEYLDPNGGFHGAVFQLNKGQGQVLKDELVAEGAHVTNLENQPTKPNAPEAKNEGS